MPVNRIPKEMEAASSDEILMQSYQNGDERAFTRLFSRYETRLYNFFLRRLGDETVTADLYQKTWLNVHRYRERYESDRSFRVWLFFIAHNLLKDEWKRRASAAEVQTDELPEVVSAALKSPVEGGLEKAELKAVVARAMSMLPEGQRDILFMSKFEGLGYGEIGEIVGLSIGAVKQKAHRAFLSLKTQLEPYMQQERA